MNTQELARLANETNALAKELMDAKPCLLQSKIKFEDHGKSVVLKANAEGFVYLASIFLQLANKGVQHSHFHFDSNSVPESSDFGFIVMFDNDPEDLSLLDVTTSP